MFDRYDEPARLSLFFARFEASRLGSRVIGSEHLLLGLIREPTGALGSALDGLPLPEIRREIESRAPSGEAVPTSVEIPFDTAATSALSRAVEEADRLGDRHIGSEHLLLGILGDEESVACAALLARGLALEGARARVAAKGRSPGPARAEAVVKVDEILALVRELGALLEGRDDLRMRTELLQMDLASLKVLLDSQA